MKSVCFLLTLILMTIQLSSVFMPIGIAAEVTLIWDAYDKADLAGYAVYQSTDSSGPLYDLVDKLFLDELSDPDKPEALVTQLEDRKNIFSL